jgi:hypothetical protein
MWYRDTHQLQLCGVGSSIGNKPAHLAGWQKRSIYRWVGHQKALPPVPAKIQQNRHPAPIHQFM